MNEVEIIEQLNTSYFNEYKELVDKNKLLDQRISQILTLSGIIMAILAFFLRDVTSTGIGKIFIIFAIIGIGVTFGFAIKSKFLKKIKAPPLGTEIYVMTTQLLDNNSDERYRNYLADINSMWIKANEDLKSFLETKSISVKNSQWSIFFTTMLIVIGMFVYYVTKETIK